MRRTILGPELLGMARGLWRPVGGARCEAVAAKGHPVRRVVKPRVLSEAGPTTAAEEVGYGFSAGGLLFPYFIGVAASLDENGLLTRDTKMAGSSAGSLISACYHAGMSPEELMQGCFRVAADCRLNGTRGRLRSVLEGVVQDLLPEDAHRLCSGKAFISITRLYPFGNELVSNFETREDLVRALLASCHVPLWFDNTLLTDYKASLCMDGGLTNLIPIPPVQRAIKICCFPMEGWGEGYKVKIAPDRYRTSKYNVQELLAMALSPVAEEGLLELYEMGRRDAQDYVDRFTTPSLDEACSRDFVFDEDDIPVTRTVTLWTRMRSVFISGQKSPPL